jgi:anti-anti-sigma factor
MSVAVQSSPTPLTLSASLISALKKPGGIQGTLVLCDGTIVTVHASGEVDAANKDSWRHLLREAAAATPSPGVLVIRTDGLDFMGGCAYTALADTADRCLIRGVKMCLVSRQTIVRRIITVTGLGSRLPVYADADTPLTADAGRSTAAGSLGAHGNRPDR